MRRWMLDSNNYDGKRIRNEIATKNKSEWERWRSNGYIELCRRLTKMRLNSRIWHQQQMES